MVFIPDACHYLQVKNSFHAAETAKKARERTVTICILIKKIRSFFTLNYAPYSFDIASAPSKSFDLMKMLPGFE